MYGAGARARQRDRTGAFQAVLAAARGTQRAPPAEGARHALLDDWAAPGPRAPALASPSASLVPGPRAKSTPFAQQAQALASDLGATREKLLHLETLVQHGRSADVSTLTVVVKSDLAAANAGLTRLPTLAAPRTGSRTRAPGRAEHEASVVGLLQAGLAALTGHFQELLERRTQMLKAAHAHAAPASTSSVLRARRSGAATTAAARHRQMPGYDLGPAPSWGPEQEALEESGGTAAEGYLALEMGGSRGGQMQVLEEEDERVQQRSRAMESIEATISELGQMFGQLAHMVAAQQETVQRIDADVLAVGENVSAAQGELLRFYAHVRSNRTLMLKIFAILILLFLVFVLVS